RDLVRELRALRIEPVLLSSASRGTCEAIGKKLAVTHVRAELSHEEKLTEVRSMHEAGHQIAVVGDYERDAEVLAAAELAIGLHARNNAPRGERRVAILSSNAAYVARTLEVARLILLRSKRTFVLLTAPGIVSLFLVAFGVLPIALASILGAAAAALALM